MDVETRREFERFNPGRALDWRWQAACRIVADRRHVSRRRDEPVIIEAVRYLRALARAQESRGRASIRGRWPALFEAHQLVQRGGHPLWEVEAWILAGEDDATIAARCALSAKAIGRYEALFFRVRDRLRASDWILTRAIGRPILVGVGEHDLGAVWRAFGYFAGPLVLDVVIAVSLDRGLPAWVGASAGAARADVEEHLRLQCRLAIAADQLPRDVDPLRLSALYLEIRRREAEERAGQVPYETRARWMSRMLEEMAPLRPGSGLRPLVLTPAG